MDLRDVATAHRLAVENDKADGHRFVVVRLSSASSQHPFFPYSVTLTSNVPTGFQSSPTTKIHPIRYPALIAKYALELADRLPTPPNDFVPPDTFDIECGGSVSILGLKYHSTEETLGETARWIFKVADGAIA